jgi:hypothetical protein
MPGSGTVIEDALAAWIEALPAAVALGAKVYPFASAPQAGPRPYVTYHRIRGGRIRSLTGPSGVSHPRIQLDTWSRDYKQGKQLHQAIVEAIDGFSSYSGTLMTGRTVQVAIVEDEYDFQDAFNTPPRHGDEVSEYRFLIELSIWFKE